ncbi:MAG: hypothetical protein EPO26_05515 [Chloroflexota bacterium]|nr:MAG: hypothetical protein EPO26_05515 [Chloroflexota bacterium]
MGVSTRVAAPANRAMTYDEFVRYLDETWVKHSVADTIRGYPFDELIDLLQRRGNPERGLSFVHVTGSKGKGSTATLIGAILTAHGLAAGTFTSPHLVRVEERIRVNGVPVDGERLATTMTSLIDLSRALHHEPRQIWRLFLIAALEMFCQDAIRVGAIEVGAGGRFDATNALDAPVACLTPVTLEHAPRLGTTPSEIAAQKVAIVKRGAICVTARQTPAVAAVIEAGVALAGGRLIQMGRDAGFALRASHPGGTQFDAWSPWSRFEGMDLGLLGAHQVENAGMALTAVECLLQRLGQRLNSDACRRALAQARWPGRLERLRQSPPLVYDGAHTPESARALADGLRVHFGDRRWTVIVGLVGRRDPRAFLEPLSGLAERVIAVPVPRFEQAAPSDIVRAARSLGLPADTADSAAEAVATSDGPTCVTGTLYVYDQIVRYTEATPR